MRSEAMVSRAGVHVRAAEPEDVARLVPVCLAARAESTVGPQLCSPAAQVLDEQLRLFASHSGAHVLLAEVDGEVTGLLLARVVGPGAFSQDRAVHVEAVYVAAEHRRRGIGHALVGALASIAEEAEVRHVYAVPLPGARGMQRFLARLGFAPAAAFRVVPLAARQRRRAARTAGLRALARARGIERLVARRRVTGARGPADDGAPRRPVAHVDQAG